MRVGMMVKKVRSNLADPSECVDNFLTNTGRLIRPLGTLLKL